MQDILRILLISLISFTIVSCAKKSSDDTKTTTDNTSNSDNQTTNLCNPTCSGLVAHYTFNGNSNNSVSNNYHATTKDNTTQPVLVSDRNGKLFSSYQFDGIDDYLVVDNASGLNIDNGSFSFVAWVSIDKFNGYNYTGSDGRTWGGRLIFASDLNNMTNLGWGRWNDMEENTVMYSFAVDNATTWHTNYIKIYIHIAAVFDKDNKKLIYYVYGKKKEETNWSGSYLLPVTKFHFGSNANKSNFTNMRIDDFQIYKKSLSQSEVIELYQRTSFDTSSPTVTSTSPPDNSSSFSVSDNISVTFSETMDTTRSQPTPLTLPVPEPFRCPRTTSVLVSRCLRLLSYQLKQDVYSRPN